MSERKTPNKVQCPALFLSAPASGQGKTTLTVALARMLRRQGKEVRIFKTGPDYLDPQILEQASGFPVKPIDLWMAGHEWCQQQFYEAAQTADLILVEGAMGMFDGEPSSADLAAHFNIPVAIIMDVKGMAQTAAAIAMGLANYRQDIQVVGLIANKCGSERHRQLIEDALPDSLPLLATLARSDEIALPERHLGLVQASEISAALELQIERSADAMARAGAENFIEQLKPIFFEARELANTHGISPKTLDSERSDQKPLKDKTIAVAKDQAFSFIYEANVDVLEAMGASVCYFSPLYDQALPEADAIWLPGGYPELHAATLAENTRIREQLVLFWQAGKSILAECGGFLYCLETLTDLNDEQYPMLGLMAGHGAMRGKRGCQGMQTAPLPEGDVRGHAHHRSRSDGTPTALAYGIRQRHPAPGEAIYRERGLTASYLHLFFPSNPKAIAQLLLGA